MRAFIRTAALCVTLLAFLPNFAQEPLAQDSKKEPSGSVSGRVIVGDKPLPHAVVMLSPSDRGPQQRTPPARATTDEEGGYRITGVPAGSYSVVPFTPAFVVATETSVGQPGKSVSLSEGEEVDGFDFSLTRGGVITGRVTDPDGRPLIEQRINIMRVDERGQRMPTAYFNPFMFTTDDRGVYRLYGLTPGRYKISVGDSPDSGMIRIGFGGGVYSRTFYPDVADESKAAIIEVRAGGETADIDIKLGRASKTFAATGRVVDADSGKPLANLGYGHGALTGQQTTIGSFGYTNNRTNFEGGFRIEGLSPGRYGAFVVATEQAEYYSEPAVFEVNDADVSGLEIKVRRGSSISGLAVIEGSNDPEVLARVSKLELRTFVRSEEVTAPILAPILIGADGTFRITGLRSGKVRITLGGFPPPKGFSLLRVEREGMDQRDGVDVAQGENVSGVRVVIGYGTGVIRGQVKVQDGQTTPPDLRFRVVARRLDRESPMTASTVVDTRGRFSLEGLMAGEYEIVLTPMYVNPSSPGGPAALIPIRTLAKQNVSVANGTETEVTLVVDLSAKDKDGEK